VSTCVLICLVLLLNGFKCKKLRKSYYPSNPLEQWVLFFLNWLHGKDKCNFFSNLGIHLVDPNLQKEFFKNKF